MSLSGADLDLVDGVPEPCLCFQIYKITGVWDLKTAKLIYLGGGGIGTRHHFDYRVPKQIW